MTAKQRIENIKKSLPKEVTLVAVSKTKPVSMIQELYDLGQKDFGENRVQELVKKQEALPHDIAWHMIGHLQTNKVKFIAPFVSLIHAVDSIKLLKEVNKQAQKNNRVIPVLLQAKIAIEDSKFGLSEMEIDYIVKGIHSGSFSNITLKGFMGMATLTDNKLQIKNEFNLLKSIFDKYKKTQTFNIQIDTLSMGMSSDYKIAIECGSNLIRLGSVLFGKRS